MGGGGGDIVEGGEGMRGGGTLWREEEGML